MDAALENNAVRQMVMARNKPSKDFVFVSEEGFSIKRVLTLDKLAMEF